MIFPILLFEIVPSYPHPKQDYLNQVPYNHETSATGHCIYNERIIRQTHRLLFIVNINGGYIYRRHVCPLLEGRISLYSYR